MVDANTRQGEVSLGTTVVRRNLRREFAEEIPPETSAGIPKDFSGAESTFRVASLIAATSYEKSNSGRNESLHMSNRCIAFVL